MTTSPEELLSTLAPANYQPLNAKELARLLKVAASDLDSFHALLAGLERDGHIVSFRNGLYTLPARLGLVAGKISMNERGFGFLVTDSPADPDVFIPAGETLNAFHNDRVLARLNNDERRRRERSGKDRGPSGTVIKVLRRARQQIVGTLHKAHHLYRVTPDEPKIPHDIVVPMPKEEVALGQKVVVKLDEWTDPKVSPEGVIIEVLGAPGAPNVDLLSITRKYELPEEFDEDVLREVAAIPLAIPEEEIARREDFRKQFVFTIDPDDAKDFDDALSYRTLPNDELEVAIHIADVSTYVRPGTRLDEEARKRGNSVYLVHRVLPMLPEKLSNGLCSLQPEVDRLVKTVLVRLGKKGEILSTRFSEGIIHSKQRLTYQQAMSQIEKPRGEIGTHVGILHRFAQMLRARRFRDGALALDFPEVKVRLDADGRPVKLERMENDASHQLIEEFMLLANEVVAVELKRRGKPALYRVHEAPDPQRLDDYRTMVRNLGYPAGNLNHRGEIQKLLKLIQGVPEEPVIKVNLLKSMKRAIYTPNPLGHFGLAKANYTHFTSPIRRYSDLVVHRALFPRGAAPAVEQPYVPSEPEAILENIDFAEAAAPAPVAVPETVRASDARNQPATRDSDRPSRPRPGARDGGGRRGRARPDRAEKIATGQARAPHSQEATRPRGAGDATGDQSQRGGRGRGERGGIDRARREEEVPRPQEGARAEEPRRAGGQQRTNDTRGDRGARRPAKGQRGEAAAPIIAPRYEAPTGRAANRPKRKPFAPISDAVPAPSAASTPVKSIMKFLKKAARTITGQSNAATPPPAPMPAPREDQSDDWRPSVGGAADSKKGNHRKGQRRPSRAPRAMPARRSRSGESVTRSGPIGGGGQQAPRNAKPQGGRPPRGQAQARPRDGASVDSNRRAQPAPPAQERSGGRGGNSRRGSDQRRGGGGGGGGRRGGERPRGNDRRDGGNQSRVETQSLDETSGALIPSRPAAPAFSEASQRTGMPTMTEMALLAKHLCDTERNAQEAEQESVKLKKLEYFQIQAGEPRKKSFPALVLEVRSGGLLVELPEFLVTGMVALKDMRGDIYYFNAGRQELTAQKTKTIVRAGARVLVHIVHVDLMRRRLDFGTGPGPLLAE